MSSKEQHSLYVTFTTNVYPKSEGGAGIKDNSIYSICSVTEFSFTLAGREAQKGGLTKCSEAEEKKIPL